MNLYNNGLKEARSNDYIVEVSTDGKRFEEAACFCAPVRCRRIDGNEYCDTMVNTSFVSFEHAFDTPVFLKITPKREFRQYLLRPFCGESEKSGGRVIVKLTEPAKFSAEFDGDIYGNLFVYAEAEETEEPCPTDENVIYFGKGVHDAGEIRLTDNQTLYLEGGAFVYGRIYAENAKNISVLGRGIISGKYFEHEWEKPRFQEVRFISCENVKIKDVIVLDSPSWTFSLDLCNHVEMDNVKEICQALNSDGLDLSACQNVTVTNCFFRVFDDCVSLKAKHAGHSGDVRNIVVDRCVFWADAAHVLLVGPESDPEKHCVFENIRFSNIVALQHMEFSGLFQGVLSIFCADDAVIRDVTFENVYVDRMDHGRVISVIYTDAYASAIGRSIENIRFENIFYNGNQRYGNRIHGADEAHTVENVVVKNFRVCGKKETEEENSFETPHFVHGLKFE